MLCGRLESSPPYPTNWGYILRIGATMASKPDELLPTASDYMKKLALSEAEEASKHARELAEADAEKHPLIDRLRKPSGVSDEEAIHRAVKVIERAVKNGQTEVQVTAFPTDFARIRVVPSISRSPAG